MFRCLPKEDFEVCAPLEIKSQDRPDKCTSCALAAIAEDKLGVLIDDGYIYDNSIRDDFGIKPSNAIASVVDKGVRTQTGSIFHPFSRAKKVWGWSLFDECREVMFYEKKSLFCGIYWQPEWTFIKDGMATPVENWTKFMPHAFKVFGQKNINGIIYLKVQNSQGIESGDNGIWYFPKEVADKFSFVYKLIE